MILGGNRRVSPSACVVGMNGGTKYYATAGGPVGSATMMFAAVVWMPRLTSIGGSDQVIFSGTNFSTGVGGWAIALSAGALNVAVVSGGGVVTNHQTVTGVFNVAVNQGIPFIIIGQLVGGSISSSVTGKPAATPTAVVGYTAKPAGQRTAIGAQDALAASGTMFWIGDCAFLNGYDGTGFVSSVFGNGLAGINAMWAEDLQQGRPLTWPRAAVANSDWYWRAADVTTSAAPDATWTDRYSAFGLARSTLPPQSGTFPSRF